MIGWYAHHHGAGHIARLGCVRAHLRSPMVAFSSRPAPGVRQLPFDVEAPRSGACAGMPTSPRWHYAPIGVDGVRSRMAEMARWAAEADPDLVVVDVSVEVAGLFTLLSVPTMVVRQHGRRQDAAHLGCLAEAGALLAPFPSWLEEDGVGRDITDKTIYTGGFSRMDGRGVSRREARRRLQLSSPDRLVVVMAGEGGRSPWPIEAAAEATPGWRWQVLGRNTTTTTVAACWVPDPRDWLCAADVVVTHAGHNSIMEVAALRRPMVVLPQDRPFDEQRHKAALLARHDVAFVTSSWPTTDEWATVLDRAAGQSTAGMARLVDGSGAARAAAAIDATAQRFARPGRVPSCLEGVT